MHARDEAWSCGSSERETTSRQTVNDGKFPTAVLIAEVTLYLKITGVTGLPTAGFTDTTRGHNSAASISRTRMAGRSL